MTIYNINIATSQAGLDVPMSLAPASIKQIKPDEIITASGVRVLNGLWGWELNWIVTDPTDLYDIVSRTGGTSESSIAGFIRVPDIIPRSAAFTWSDNSAFLDQFTESEIRQGTLRYNVRVRARQLVPYAALA